jgi:hypothetical protein
LLRLLACAGGGLGSGLLAGALVDEVPSPFPLLQRALREARADSTAGMTVLFVFTPDECPATMRVIRRLNLLATTPHLAVAGVLLAEADRFPDWGAVARANRIAFPVVREPERFGARLRRSLGATGSPLLVVTTARGGKVVAAGGVAEPRIIALLDSLPAWAAAASGQVGRLPDPAAGADR